MFSFCKHKQTHCGQGTIEYLVILAIIVVISLIVVSLIINSTLPAQGIQSTTSQITSASNPISITNAVVSEDGNYFLKIKNNTGENLTIKDIQIGDTLAEPNNPVFASGELIFIISSEIVCIEGQLITNQITITYLTQNGLEKKQTYPLP